MKKILVPVAFPITSRAVLQEVATLARRFKSEIILLYVVPPPERLPGMPMEGRAVTDRDCQAAPVRRAQGLLDLEPLPELDGVTVRRSLHEGDPAREIVRTALAEGIDLIAMSTHRHGMLYPLLLASTVAKVLHRTNCAVWTDSHPAEKENGFAIRKVLCAVNLSAHSRSTALSAAQFAAECGASLTLVHITPGVETYGPGGLHEVPEWKKSLDDYAREELGKLGQDLPVAVSVSIDSGAVRERLNDVALMTKSDVMVLGRKPPGGHLGDNGTGYAIIRDAQIPVLSL